MASEPQTVLSPSDAAAAQRKRLIQGAAVAGAAVIALLGGLAAYDNYNRPAPPAAVSAQAVAPSPAPTVEPPKPELATAGAEAPKPEPPPAEQEATSAPQYAETAGANADGQVKKRAAGGAGGVTNAADEGSAGNAPHAHTASRPTSGQADRARPSAQPAGQQPDAAAPHAGQFMVQVGVFGNPANADELRAKLDAAGIPSQVEVRVRAGPFTDRHEAQQAMDKIHSLGVKSTLLVPAVR